MLVAIYLIEVGLLLIVAPLTGMWWQRNFFADLAPWLRSIMALGSVRGAVAVAGVVTTLAGVSELRDAIFGRATAPVQSETRQTPDA